MIFNLVNLVNPVKKFLLRVVAGTMIKAPNCIASPITTIQVDMGFTSKPWTSQPMRLASISG